MKKILLTLTIIMLAALLAWKLKTNSGVPQFFVADGFSMSVYAAGLNKPSVMVSDPSGNMLVSEPESGKIIRLRDLDNNSVADEKFTVIDNLKSPYGMAFYTDPKTNVTYLYVAEELAVNRYAYDTKRGEIFNRNGKNIVTLREGGMQKVRNIGIGADFRDEPVVAGLPRESFLSPIKLYVSVGASCNVCLENSWKYAAILESDLEGTYTAELAGGLRSSIFSTFHPITGELWATEASREGLGDLVPSDEINIIKPGLKYGWPYCYNKQIQDRTFTENPDRSDLPTDCAKTEPPIIELPAHSESRGIVFVPENWTEKLGQEILVAFHGESSGIGAPGFKIVKIQLDEQNRITDLSDFISGWASPNGKRVYGKPLDLVFSPSGDLFISDDVNGTIYRVKKI